MISSIKEKRNLAVTGALIGVVAIVLMVFGNPGNMGFCIACFIRDISGALNLHNAAIVQYMRPEIIGIVLGAFIISVIKGEFKPRAGSAPVLRFVLGFFMMVGALVFLGCPLRMVLRLAAGDMNAFVGLLGFITGIAIGSFFLNNGFSLGRAHDVDRIEGTVFPLINIVLLFILLFFPSLLKFSESGPGSMHAPIVLSLLVALIVGMAAQRTRLCMAGGIRDIFLIKDFTLITGFVFIFIASLICAVSLTSKGKNDVAIIMPRVILRGAFTLQRLLTRSEGFKPIPGITATQTASILTAAERVACASFDTKRS